MSPPTLNLGVGPQLVLVSETCLPVPHEEFGAVGVEGEGKRDAYQDCSGAKAGTAVSILLILPESKGQSGAWNLVCGFQVPVLHLCAWGLTSGFYISLGVRGQRGPACPVPSLDLCSLDNLNPPSLGVPPSQEEGIDSRSTHCWLFPEFLSARKPLVLGPCLGYLAQVLSSSSGHHFPRAAPVPRRSFLIRHLMDPVLIFGAGNVIPGNDKPQKTPSSSASLLLGLCGGIPSHVRGGFCALAPHSPQLSCWPLVLTLICTSAPLPAQLLTHPSWSRAQNIERHRKGVLDLHVVATTDLASAFSAGITG